MEELVTLIFVLVIVVVNVFKFFIEKGGKSKKKTAPNRIQPERTPSTLERFFADLAEQMEPKPQTLPDLPEGFERPDYAQEMTEFDQTQEEAQKEEHDAEIIPFVAPEPAKVRREPPPMRSANPSPARFKIKGKNNLKQAMIAHIIFSPPRAFDLSFTNTLPNKNPTPSQATPAVGA